MLAGDRLDLQLYQRSADLALGIPFNIASYATLLMMVARCNLTPGEFVHTIGDARLFRPCRRLTKAITTYTS